MTVARRRQVCLDSTPYYHCIARCVRRAFLCGEDPLTGRSFSHRKRWVVDRFKVLSTVFAIDICAYAVMSNHYHLVLHVDRERAEDWSDDAVIERWYRLFNGHVLVDRLRAGEVLTEGQREAVQAIVETWRCRLYDISWFMRCLNESIARQANAEDQCKGRFWEGRFKSQVLLDEAALLTCMSYVDLNPIRAGISETPETSEFTSICERIKCLKAAEPGGDKTPHTLSAFADDSKQEASKRLPLSFGDYLQLVDWTGRAIRDDKRGAIPERLAPVLDRLGIEADDWVVDVSYYGRRVRKIVGACHRIRAYCVRVGQSWAWGQAAQVGS